MVLRSDRPRSGRGRLAAALAVLLLGGLSGEAFAFFPIGFYTPKPPSVDHPPPTTPPPTTPPPTTSVPPPPPDAFKPPPPTRTPPPVPPPPHTGGTPPTPEPSTLASGLLGLGAIAVWRRRSRKKN